MVGHPKSHCWPRGHESWERVSLCSSLEMTFNVAAFQFSAFFLIFGVLCLFTLVSFLLNVLELLFLTQQLRYCQCFAFLAWLQLFLYLDNRFFLIKLNQGCTSVLHRAEPWIPAELLDCPFKSGFSHVTHVCFTLRETQRK